MVFETAGVIITAPKNVSLENISITSSSEDDVLVSVELCGLCTPEQRAYKGTGKLYPYWGGHELIGTIKKVFTNRVSLQEGSKVVVALMSRCGSCFYCSNGLSNHCSYVSPPTLTNFKYTGPRGLSSLIAVPSYKLFPITGIDISNHYFALVEPIACVIRSIQSAMPLKGEVVFVVGGGTMGLLHTSILANLGYKVIVFEEQEVHDIAKKAGAFLTFPFEKLTKQTALEITGGIGPAGIFCTRFGVQATSLSVDFAARGGVIVLFQSIPDDATLQLNANVIHYKELRIIGSIAQTNEDIFKAISFVSNNSKKLEFLNIKRISALESSIAFETALRSDVHRVHVDFSTFM